jgi:hypothetical protein
MDVFSTELEIWLSFVKTLEFWRGGGFEPPNPPRYATEMWDFISHKTNPDQKHCGLIEILYDYNTKD